jgi:hypothetical protein
MSSRENQAYSLSITKTESYRHTYMNTSNATTFISKQLMQQLLPFGRLFSIAFGKIHISEC